MNRFDLLGLDWNPDWWVLVDVRLVDDWWDWEDLLWRDSMFVFREQDRVFIEPYGRENVIYVSRCDAGHLDGKVESMTDWDWHLPDPCTRGGAVSIALQIAAELGKDPIYLVGCDLYKYRGPDDVDINHFHDEYCPYKVRKRTGEELIGEYEWDRLNKRLIRAHTMARDSAQSMGVSIFNATVGGALDVYERRDIWEVLGAVDE